MDSERLRAKARELGFDLVGLCDATPSDNLPYCKSWVNKGRHAGMAYLADSISLRADPRNVLPGAQSALVVGLNYNQPRGNGGGEAKIARYALGRDYHKVIRSKLRKLARELSLGEQGVDFRVCVDSAPLLERELAHSAGLGWFGKNTCLIDSKRGSWFVLGVLLTRARFEPDKPATGQCGTCRACIDACPTGAIVFDDGRWQVDSNQCISYLTIEHRGEFTAVQAQHIGDWTFGCDVCQEVCPFNQERASQPLRGQVSREPEFQTRRAWPSLLELTELTHEQWDRLTQGSAVRRAGVDGIKRNARANLANGQK